MSAARRHRLILAALALYRVARMLAWEDGPGYAFLLARGRVAARYGETSWQFEGVSCPLCIGFWLAPLVSALAHTRLGRRLLEPLALAGAATLIQRLERPQ